MTATTASPVAALKALQQKRKRIAPKVDPARRRLDGLEKMANQEIDTDGAVSAKTNGQLQNTQRELEQLLASLSRLDVEIPKAQTAVERETAVAELGPSRDEIAKSAMRARELFEGAVDEMATLRPLLTEFTTQAKKLGFGVSSSLADGRRLALL